MARRKLTAGGVITILAAIVFALGAVILGNWYWYVAHGASPYEEVGIGLNRRMPAPLRQWGCGRIAERFPGTLPPYGCETSRP